MLTHNFVLSLGTKVNSSFVFTELERGIDSFHVFDPIRELLRQEGSL